MVCLESCICGLLPRGGSMGPYLGEIPRHRKKKNSTSTSFLKLLPLIIPTLFYYLSFPLYYNLLSLCSFSRNLLLTHLVSWRDIVFSHLLIIVSTISISFPTPERWFSLLLIGNALANLCPLFIASGVQCSKLLVGGTLTFIFNRSIHNGVTKSSSIFQA